MKSEYGFNLCGMGVLASALFSSFQLMGMHTGIAILASLLVFGMGARFMARQAEVVEDEVIFKKEF